jgi:hypothetical protein
MQRRHFNLLAEKVRHIFQECEDINRPLTMQQKEIIIVELADFCQHFDRSVGFNRTKFREACNKETD